VTGEQLVDGCLIGSEVGRDVHVEILVAVIEYSQYLLLPPGSRELISVVEFETGNKAPLQEDSKR
jgi:hypothetical protein